MTLSIHLIEVRWTAHNETAVAITLYARDTLSFLYLMPLHQGEASGASTDETKISKETFSIQLHHRNEKRVPFLTCEKRRSNCRIFSHVIQWCENVTFEYKKFSIVEKIFQRLVFEYIYIFILYIFII